MNARKIRESALLKKLGKFVSVRNLESRNGCGSAPNQFEIIFEHGKVFQSYNTLIGVNFNGEWYFTDWHDYSNTTSSHATRWCNYDCRERRKGLADGTFISIER